MKKNSIMNAVLVGFVLLILYVFVGHDFVKFYTGGKAEMLDTAARINELCAAHGACPTTLAGWRPQGNKALAKGNMLYFASTDTGNRPQAFRLVYRFFLPDDWFEAAGGVDKPVTAGWQGRP